MSERFLNFTIAETSGRTFEVPMDKVKELVAEYIKDYAGYGEKVEVDITDDYDVAKILVEYLDDIAKYELSNDYTETEVTDSYYIGED